MFLRNPISGHIKEIHALMTSTSSTPFQSLPKKEYDVFLSFRGTDTRKNFVDHLYKELQQKGIRTFKDDEGLEKGHRIEKLHQIIRESQFAVVVFSQDYASAKWCLEEIATIMECQQKYGEEIVIPIFYDVEPSVVRNQTESFAESFKRHEEKNTEKAKVERWKEALKKAGKSSGYHLQNDFNGPIGAREDMANHHRSDSGLLRTNDIGCLTSLESEIEYLNHGSESFGSLPACYSQLPSYRYLDISGCKELKELPELPTTIRELYANFSLASESNITKLATKYPTLYSVSFSSSKSLNPQLQGPLTPAFSLGYKEVSAVELARKFAHAPFLFMRDSSFIVTYPDGYISTDRDVTKWFKYSSHHSNKISISLESSWYNQSFVGFVVCFIFNSSDGIWKSCPDGRPFRYGEVIAQLVHKDNEQLLQTNCVIGRLCDEEFDSEFKYSEIICFAYIPFLSLFKNKLSATPPSDYLVFEVAFASNASTDWSCGLLYNNDESLSEAIWSKTIATSHDNGDSGHSAESPIDASDDESEPSKNVEGEEGESIDGDEDVEEYESDAGHSSGPNVTELWEFTEIVDRVQCRMVSMPECSDAKVFRLLYTNSGVGILALSSNGIQKLWKWPNNEQNPTGKATANSVPQHWQPTSGPFMINDVIGVNLEKVVPCIDLSKNDSYIVSAAGGKISLFNIMTYRVLTKFRPSPTPTFLVFYPWDNNIIAIGTEDGTICIYNVKVDQVMVEFIKGHHKHITGLAFSTTNRDMLVSSSADAQLCVWEIFGRWRKRISVRIQLPAGKVHSGDTHVMFHTDQLHLLVTHETQLAIYDTYNMERKRQWFPQGCLSARISSATYSCNSQLVYASFVDGNIGVLDADNLTLRCRIAPSAYLSQPILNSKRVVYAVVIAAHPQEPNQLAIGLTNGSIKVIEPLESEGEWGISPLIDIEILNDRTKLWELTKIIDQVQCQVVSMPECSDAKVSGLLYTNSGVGILRLRSDSIQKLWKWSYNEQNPSKKNWKPNSGPSMINDVPSVNLEEVAPCIALSNDDSYIVSAVGKKVALFNIMTSEVLKIITTLPSASTFLAFDPHDNNIIAIGTEKSSIYIYGWVNEELIELNEHLKPITGLAFSTKLKMLVSGDADAQLCVWNTNLWKKRRSVRIQLPSGKVPSEGDTHVMFHADQLHLLVTHETQLAIYDASKMELIHQCIPHVSPSMRISSATYSCNSQLIYASFIDGNIGVLDADTLRLKCRIVPSAYLSQNGSEDVYPLVIAAHPHEPNQFAVGLTDGSIKVIEPLKSQGNWEVSVSSPVDNGKKNGRLVWQVLRGTLATICLGLFGVGIIRIIQIKTRKSKMNFDGYMTDGSRTNRPDETEKGEREPNNPKAEFSARPIKVRL
ncbi:PREDICTED: uncharacterized protein LOC109149060 isoform X4 [Ipomoea nil]|uniref:uncharacterized protein LOC109149060 isoform X4 n=1 Tax=Ipomoea nil TaxID=35883 RepID=UPI00090095DD|nr:PREDICTED: uncharacterized protein LOC109149060 isoform X4 [Ipomoea nil]